MLRATQYCIAYSAVEIKSIQLLMLLLYYAMQGTLFSILLFGLLLADFQCTKTFSFCNRSYGAEINFGYRLVTAIKLTIFAPCQIFTLSPH